MKQTELNKQLKLLAKEYGKQAGWKSIDGTLYWTSGPLFFHLVLAASAKEGSFYAALRFKWPALDNKLWQVLGMSSNEREPFSLHANGAFVIRGQELFAISLQSLAWTPGVLEQQIQTAVEQARQEAMQVAAQIQGLDGYLAFIHQRHQAFMDSHPQASVNLAKEDILAALIVDDLARAEQIARERIQANEHGGFSVQGKSFHALALDYCAIQRAQRAQRAH